eukprot:9657617-Alexandrium_andersonii.AAC.1
MARPLGRAQPRRSAPGCRRTDLTDPRCRIVAWERADRDARGWAGPCARHGTRVPSRCARTTWLRTTARGGGGGPHQKARRSVTA